MMALCWGAGEEGQPLERRFGIVDWINLAQVVDKYHSELLLRYHRTTLYIFLFLPSTSIPICYKMSKFNIAFHCCTLSSDYIHYCFVRLLYVMSYEILLYAQLLIRLNLKFNYYRYYLFTKIAYLT
jgi:hypothetical protein